MQRITDKNLQAVVDRINRITGSPESYSDKQPDGSFKSNIGHYCLDGAYGGVSLHRIFSTGGGCEDVLSCGHVTKRQLYELMHAWIRGYNAAKESVK